MVKIDSRSYSQIYSYLNLLGEDYINKMPKDKYLRIVEMKDDEYNPKYSLEDFNDEKTSEATRYIILYFYLNYWCESEEIKKKIINKLDENDKRLNEKYSPFKKIEQNIINNLNINLNNEDNKENNYEIKQMALIEKKEKWYEKILLVLKSIFKK